MVLTSDSKGWISGQVCCGMNPRIPLRRESSEGRAPTWVWMTSSVAGSKVVPMGAAVVNMLVFVVVVVVIIVVGLAQEAQSSTDAP